MVKQATVNYKDIKRNGVALTNGDIISNSIDIGYFRQKVGTYDEVDPITWEALMVHPYETTGTEWDGDSYVFRMDLARDDAGLTKGDEQVKQVYRLWTGSAYTDYLTDALAKQSWVDDVLDVTITIDSTDDPERTSITLIFVANVDEFDYNAGDQAHDFKPILFQITPKVTISSHNLNTASLTNNKISTTASINAGAYSINIGIGHAHPNASVSTVGEGAWRWLKETSLINEDRTWAANTTTTGNLVIDQEISGITVNYYLELFINNGIRSEFPGDGSDPSSLIPDRTIKVEVVFS